MEYLLNGNTRIWVKEESSKHFHYMPVAKINTLLAQKVKVLTMNINHEATPITDCKFFGQIDLFELKSFSGSKITVSENVCFYIDDIWVPLKEIKYHEYLVEFDILTNHFKESYAVGIKRVPNTKAYQLTVTGNNLVADNFLISLTSQ